MSLPQPSEQAPALTRAQCNAIARRFLPGRWHYHYVRSKLASDPLFAGVAGALEGTDAALLDLGCGIGLLLHYLRTSGQQLEYLGMDNDAAKVATARAAAERAGLTGAHFEVLDLALFAQPGSAAAAARLPEHHGSVALLDVLQFLPPAAHTPLLRAVAACIAPGGKLVIRTGLDGRGWRVGITRAVDRFSRLLGWMNTGPKAYPERAALASLLESAGLSVRFTPLWGSTPFNNWLVVASRPAVGSSGNTQR